MLRYLLEALLTQGSNEINAIVKTQITINQDNRTLDKCFFFLAQSFQNRLSAGVMAYQQINFCTFEQAAGEENILFGIINDDTGMNFCVVMTGLLAIFGRLGSKACVTQLF